MAVPPLPAVIARQLRLVTFDVTGTLLNFRRSPAEQYADIGAQMGVHAEPSELAIAFKRQWKLLSNQHPNFGAATGLPWQSWWSTLVQQTFLSAPSLRLDSGTGEGQTTKARLASVADCLIEAYSTGECWRVAENAEGILLSLQREGLILGVISNFDSRLNDLLMSVGLLKFFSFVMASYELGVAKPDVRIFHEALRRAGREVEEPLEPQEACHVGDTPSSDYMGARAAGWHAVLVGKGYAEEGGLSPMVDHSHTVGSLKELESYLLKERDCTT